MQNSLNQRFGASQADLSNQSGTAAEYTGQGQQSSYAGGPANTYAGNPTTQASGRMTGYGSAGLTGSVSGASYNTAAGSTAGTGFSAGAGMAPSAPSGYAGGGLTQAGVSNFSQQVNNAYQQLQKVQRELIQTQNQIEVQAQAQLRQLKQLQQLIEAAGSEVQQIDAMSRNQQSGGRYPLS